MNSKTAIKEKIKNLSVREKLGQLLMLDFRYWGKDKKGNKKPFSEMNNTVKAIISNYNLGGIALFRENTSTPEQIVTLVNEIQKSAKIPLLLGIDQEGGIVTRLQTGTDMPGNMSLGAADDLSLTKKVAETIGKELYSLGINLNFAPDIDVNSNQLNPIIGIRSFSSSSKKVAEHGKAYINGLNNSRIISCVKHFPGHGNTVTDTHLGLATVDYSLIEVEKIDLVPFYDVFKAGADTVMAAHVCVPSLDNSKIKSIKTGKEITVPTTFSKKILTGLLREKMDFSGVVLTDALDMKAISNNFGNSESVILSILAGVDMPVMPIRIWDENDIYKIENLISAMEAEYHNNKEFNQRVEHSLLRILDLKQKYSLIDKIEAHNNIEKAIENANQIVGCNDHKEIEKTASLKGITLLKNENNTLPFDLKNKNKILLLDSNNLRLQVAVNEINLINKQIERNVSVNDLKIDYTNSLNKSLKTELAIVDFVILNTYNLKESDILPEEICQFALQNNLNLVVVATRNPYDISYIPSCPAYIAIYGATSFDQTNYMQASLDVNIKSAIRTIFTCKGDEQIFFKPSGKLPVDIKSFKNNKILYPKNFRLNY